MRLYVCPSCGGALYIHNLSCWNCGQTVAYDPDADRFVAAERQTCSNRGLIDCPWTVPTGAGGADPLCRSCAMTTVIPEIVRETNRAHWAAVEAAKRWVLIALARWGWFTPGDHGRWPVFHMLAEETVSGEVPVSMGHAAGVVTLNVSEADAAIRTRRRANLNEPLRTLVGHVRHELAHVLFERLAIRDGFLSAFRATFGDERADYGTALDHHYCNGPPADWADRHVTAYASAHPHEDWAETVAHLLHLTDIVDSAQATELRWSGGALSTVDAYAEPHTDRLVASGVALGLSLNHINRSMGLPDLYPFVLNDAVRAKLVMAHGWLRWGP